MSFGIGNQTLLGAVELTTSTRKLWLLDPNYLTIDSLMLCKNWLAILLQ